MCMKRDPQPVAMRLRHRLGQAVLHQEAVRQAGEHVVVGKVLHPLLGALAFGHVARGEHDAADTGMLEQIVAEYLEVDPGAVCMPEPQSPWATAGLALRRTAENASRARATSFG